MRHGTLRELHVHGYVSENGRDRDLDHASGRAHARDLDRDCDRVLGAPDPDHAA